MSTQTTPTGLLGPAGILAFAWLASASQKRSGLYANVGFLCTPLTFHSPIGSGSCSLPVVTGAYIRTLPAASVTTMSDVLLRTVTVTAEAAPVSPWRPPRAGGPAAGA